MFGFSSKIRSITNFDKQHERILPPPTHHNISWTSKLISRDLKSVTKGKGSRIANKVMGIFVTKKPIPKVPATGQQPSSTLAITTPAVIQGPELTSKNLKCAVPKHIKKNSESIADAGSKEQVFGIRPDTCETGVTSSEGHAVPDDVLIPIPKVLQEKSFYTILSDKLEFWYKNRKFGLPHQDRWLTRGICVFLHIVVQVCPFNPTYDLLRGEREGPDHNKFVRELLHLTSSKGHQKFLLALGLDLSTRVSAPPGGIYSSSCTNDIRIDSAHSGVSPTIWPACSNKEDRHSKIPPSSQELWIALLVAVTFREDTLMFAEALLKTILPNEDAHGFLIRIGDPSRRLREGETTMLFEKLQPLLYPGYEQLYK